MDVNKLTIFSPAKINLFLAVTGCRNDGFHNILSLAAPIEFGDHLDLEFVADEDKIICDIPSVPTDNNNLIMKAIKAFRAQHPFTHGIRVTLTKRIPLGSGLGGGSSNAVATLIGINKLLGNLLSKGTLFEMAKGIGSDCPLFLEEAPVIMRGRGDYIESVDETVINKLKGKRILLFKHNITINTQWAYEKMKLNPNTYIDQVTAEGMLNYRIRDLINNNMVNNLLFNNFENIIFKEYNDLKLVIDMITKEFENKGLLSGSGSSCFCFIKEDKPVEDLKERIKKVLGKDTFVVESRIR